VVGGSNPLTPTFEQTDFVNDLVNKLLAMVYSQGKPQKPTEFMIGGLQIGTPTASQRWVDEFLASRRQGLSDRTFQYYRDILYQLIGTDLTPKGINAWLTSLNVGNAKLNYYQVTKIFCTWLYKSRKINSNPTDLVDRPKIEKKILPAITTAQLDTLLDATENFRDKCILKLFFDSGCRLSELVGIKDTDFNWKRRTVIVNGKTGQRRAPFTRETGKMLQQWFSEHKTFELNRYGVQTMLRRLEEKTGIECNAHAFRRGFANAQFKKGLSTRVVMQLGGWQDIKTVEKYSKQFSQEDALELYDRE
jgi:site-specific recombinase XerD